VTDGTWRQTTAPPPANWTAPAFDDSRWSLGVLEALNGAAWSDARLPAGSGAWWIWYDDSLASSDMSTVWFRKAFDSAAASYTLSIAGDDSFTAYLDGTPVGTGTYSTVSHFTVTP